MKNDYLPILRFVICSDAHIEGVGAPGYIRLKKMVDFSIDFASKDENYKMIDRFIIAGDITNKGKTEEFAAFKEIFDYAKEKDYEFLCTVAKGHDSITKKKKSLGHYKKLTGQSTDFHKVICGYHFIGLSTCKSLPHKHYSPFQKMWLKNQLKKAVADTPGKPVFLIHHEHVKNTVYGSSDFDGWGNRFFTGVFDKYPNVVDFSGHSHYPINDPRSIWQGAFTAIGTGSLKYTELTVDDERKVHPATCEDCSNFLIVEADKNGNLHIIGFDCLAEEMICEYYINNPSDKNNREFTWEKQKLRSKAPVFDVNAEISIKNNYGIYSAEYPKAESADGKPVFIYRAFVYDENSNLVAESKTVPSYYLHKPEDVVLTDLGKLENGRYTVKIFAENCFDIKSNTIEKEILI